MQLSIFCIQVGISTGIRNPRVSARVYLGLGYGFGVCTPPKTRTPARVGGFDPEFKLRSKNEINASHCSAGTSATLGNGTFMLVFACFYLYYPPSPPLPIKWTLSPP